MINNICLLFILLVTIIFGCDSSTFLFPDEINREELCSIEPDVITNSGIEIVVDFKTDETEDIGNEIESRYQDFVSCMDSNGIEQVFSIADIKIIVLDIPRWECPFHTFFCDGELYNCKMGGSIIILSPDIEKLEHEWAHRWQNWDEEMVRDFVPHCGVVRTEEVSNDYTP